MKPDGFEAVTELHAKTKPILEKAGPTNVRVLSAVVAAEVTGAKALAWEADNFAGYGSAVDKVFADPDGAALGPQWTDSASSVAGRQLALWVETYRSEPTGVTSTGSSRTNRAYESGRSVR